MRCPETGDQLAVRNVQKPYFVTIRFVIIEATLRSILHKIPIFILTADFDRDFSLEGKDNRVEHLQAITDQLNVALQQQYSSIPLLSDENTTSHKQWVWRDNDLRHTVLSTVFDHNKSFLEPKHKFGTATSAPLTVSKMPRNRSCSAQSVHTRIGLDITAGT